MQADSPDTTTVSPLARASYVMSEPHDSGYRVVIGFDTREEADAAHEFLARSSSALRVTDSANLKQED